MYPFTLMPEASSTCPSVGALAAWASATVGAANAAETADAMRSFFMLSVLSWWEIKQLFFHLDCLDFSRVASDSRPKRPPPICLAPTFRSCSTPLQDVKNFR
jgi:hypothetical protein